VPNFAHVVIAGHIGGDIETRQAGKSTVTNFSVAANTGFGERETCTWWRVSVWGKRGEAAQNHLEKGSAVIISGEPCNRMYENDGQKNYSLEINNADWTFAGAKSQAGQSRAAPAASSAPSGDAMMGLPDDFSDSIPF